MLSGLERSDKKGAGKVLRGEAGERAEPRASGATRRAGLKGCSAVWSEATKKKIILNRVAAILFILNIKA